jgi:hypothetical protein
MAYTTIKKPSDYFNTKLYTGNGATSAAGTLARTITGVGFQPDFTWLKSRTSGGYETHGLHDVVRGATKWLGSDRTNVESDVTTDFGSGGLGSFTSDGFDIYSGTSSDTGNYNNSGTDYVAWNWLASNTTASNTDGSITSNVSANTTSGFSICTFTASGSGDQSFGHGLGATPKVVIIKSRTTTSGWNTYHENSYATPEDYYLSLNATDGITNLSGVWGAGMTSSVAGVGVGVGVTAGLDYVAYCFAEVKGFSKFGSYVGNGSTDGSFIYTGFKPAWVMVKRTGTASWFIKDNKRNPFNPAEQTLAPDSASSEAGWGTGDDIDLLSNGFKMKDNTTSTNLAGNSYIYMAFAEEPLVGDNPATAR